MSESTDPSFSKWRQRLWPIHRYELKKFVPLLFLKFLVSFNFILLYTTKDTLVVTSAGSSAEVIPLLKGYIVLPCAFLVLLIYTKLSNRLSHSKLIYSCLLPFLLFFPLFGFVLYPYSEFFTPSTLCSWLEGVLGPTKLHWVAVIRYWMNSLFFVTAELWGQVVIMLLFWTFANNITKMKEAKRYYTLFTAAGDFAPMIGGALIAWIATDHDFISTVKQVMSLATLIGFLVMGVFWWMARYVLTDPRFYSLEEQANLKKEKPKLSIKESLKFICSSKYLGCIALMVVGYGLALNLVEVTWKANLKMQYPDPSQYQAFMGKFSFCIGFFPLIMAVFFSGNILRRFGWYASASLTPIIVGLTGLLFLFAYMFRSHLTPLTALFGLTPLFLIVLLGTIQNIASKTMKYSLFDPTKEMAFIPLDPESKVKGKAAIDVVGSRLGKSGSAWLQAGLIDLVGAGSILNVTGIITPIIFIVVIGWLVAVRGLNKEFSSLSNEVV
ncbi:MAG: Npt1/Npt2 family nucleotide transporter [Simkaniaceae bacterium]